MIHTEQTLEFLKWTPEYIQAYEDGYEACKREMEEKLNKFIADIKKEKAFHTGTSTLSFGGEEDDKI